MPVQEPRPEDIALVKEVIGTAHEIETPKGRRLSDKELLDAVADDARHAIHVRDPRYQTHIVEHIAECEAGTWPDFVGVEERTAYLEWARSLRVDPARRAFGYLYHLGRASGLLLRHDIARLLDLDRGDLLATAAHGLQREFDSDRIAVATLGHSPAAAFPQCLYVEVHPHRDGEGCLVHPFRTVPEAASQSGWIEWGQAEGVRPGSPSGFGGLLGRG